MNNFTFFSNFLTAVEDLSKTDQKELIWAICRIGCGEDFEKIASEMKPYLKAILKSLRFDLESTKSKHLGNSKGGKNSKGGGRPNNLKLKTTQNKLKTTQNNEIEMEIEMEIEKKKENIKEKTGTEKSLIDKKKLRKEEFLLFTQHSTQQITQHSTQQITQQNPGYNSNSNSNSNKEKNQRSSFLEKKPNDEEIVSLCEEQEKEKKNLAPKRKEKGFAVVDFDFVKSYFEEKRIGILKKSKYLTEQDIIDDWRDYHLAKGTKIKDFKASFRTWVKNAISFNQLGIRKTQREIVMEEGFTPAEDLV